MKTRDWDYIETRLLSGTAATEACGRLRQMGHPDLADRVMSAAQTMLDECRAVRDELQARGDGRGR